MYRTFQNTTTIDFNSLLGKFICFLSKDSENLKTTTGKYVTNCNYIYEVKKITNSFLITESTFSNGQVFKTKLKKDTFEREFFYGQYVISDDKPVWDIEVGTYKVELPHYDFSPTTDLSKSFTINELNELLTKEFLGTTKSYREVRDCIETLCNIIMKRHFDYINIGRSYFNDGNNCRVGINIGQGKRYLESFGNICVKSYGNKINFIEFTPVNTPLCDSSYRKYVWTDFESLEDLIVTYLTDNKEYIDTL